MLQFATRAVTPHQREVQYDYPAVSFSLPSLLILATAILETNDAARLAVRQDQMRVDLEAMAIALTRLDQKSRVSSSITISRSWKPDTAIVPNTQSRAVDTAPGKHVLDVAAVAPSERKWSQMTCWMTMLRQR